MLKTTLLRLLNALYIALLISVKSYIKTLILKINKKIDVVMSEMSKRDKSLNKVIFVSCVELILISFYRFSQGRKTKFAFPLYTVGTKWNFFFRSHCIQGKRKFRFSSLAFLFHSLTIWYSSTSRVCNPRASNFWRKTPTVSNSLFQRLLEFKRGRYLL